MTQASTPDEWQGREEWLTLTFAPLPQDALSPDRHLADGEEALRLLRDWGEHLARAIRTAAYLAGHGWRVTLLADSVVAEKHTTRAELADLARDLRDDLRALTASAETDTSGGEPYLSLRDDDIAEAGGAFRPLVDQ